ncbi:hypothetical protein, partial [Candidatus Ichthyocystis hellenicum]|uniref:hypothetical protein n=1 Tax=Candidatus Ichthyocystis hellenicum TaxID=1561003 RepID=UPI0011119C77
MDGVCSSGNKYCLDQGTSRSYSGLDDKFNTCDDDECRAMTGCQLAPSIGGDDRSLSPVSLKPDYHLPRTDQNRSPIDLWGLNLHPDDSKFIFFVRRKFSIKIRSHLHRLFFCMLNGNTLLSGGILLRKCSWSVVSFDLLPIAMESIKPIMEEQYGELDFALSRSNIVEFDENDVSSCSIRKITDSEKKHLVERVRVFVSRRLMAIIRSSWGYVSKCSVEHGYKDASEDIDEREGVADIFGVSLRRTDAIDIFSISKRFLSNIKANILYAKFSKMLMNRYKFDDGTVIGKVNWFRLHKKLFPIAQDEVRSVMEDENEELEEAISRSRVVIDSTTDRELTNEEKSIVISNFTKLSHVSLKNLCKIVWDDVVTSSNFNYVDVGCSEKSASHPVDVPDVTKIGTGGRSDISKIALCYEDGRAVCRAKSKLSFKINRCIYEKFSDMLENNYKFEDDTTIGVCPWGDISKKMLPIVRKEVNEIMQKESIKINDILLKSRVDISSPDSSITTETTREVSSAEASAITRSIVNSALKRVSHNLGRVWDKAVASSGDKYHGSYDGPTFNNCAVSEKIKVNKRSKKSSLSNLEESIKVELDSIRLDFIDNLDLIIDEVVNSLSLNLSTPVRLANVISAVTKRSNNLFEEAGFFHRLESLLLDAKVVDLSGNSRSVTNEERKDVFKVFMDNICKDRDYLVKKLTGCLDMPVTEDTFIKYKCRDVVEMWGLNLHPDDGRFIFFIRRKFLGKIRDDVRRLFSGMLKDRFLFASGKMICDRPWSAVSDGLFPIAVESVEAIMREQYKELDEILSRVRVVDIFEGSVPRCFREITDDEKNDFMARANVFIRRRLIDSIRLWSDISKTSKRYSYKYGLYKYSHKGLGKCGGLVIKLRYSDDLNIMNVRRNFSSKIKSVIYDKFSEVIENGHKFNNDAVIGRLDWVAVSKELFPIAKGETKHIIENESKELEEVISKSRVLVDFGVDRELTDQEKLVSLKNVMKLVNISLRNLCRKVWDDLISASRLDCSDVGDHVVATDSQEEVLPSLANAVDPMSLDYGDKCDTLKFICYEDDRTICRVKRNISSDINRRIFSRFSSLLEDKHEFNDGTVISMCSWKSISKRMLPIAKEEISIVLEKERIKINGILSKLRVDVSPPGSSVTTRMTRLIKSEERFTIMNDIVKSIFERVVHNLGRLWNRVIHSFEYGSRELSNGCELNSTATSGTTKLENICVLSASSSDLKETDKAELDNIRLEFIGSLDSIIAEVVSSLSLNFDTS